MLTYLLVLVVGYVAGTVSGIVGTGATIILLPVLVFAFGPRAAIPIMAVVALMSNFAKITSWWKEIDWRAVACYAAGGIPGAALGARTMLTSAAAGGRHRARHVLPGDDPGPPLADASPVSSRAVGARSDRRRHRLPDRHRGVDRADQRAGLHRLRAGQGRLHRHRSGGLARALHRKAATFRSFGALPVDIVIKGLITGSSVMAGTYTARLIVERLSIATFQRLLDGVMAISGLALIWAAIRA